jgi:hypothetical protein
MWQVALGAVLAARVTLSPGLTGDVIETISNLSSVVDEGVGVGMGVSDESGGVCVGTGTGVSGENGGVGFDVGFGAAIIGSGEGVGIGVGIGFGVVMGLIDDGVAGNSSRTQAPCEIVLIMRNVKIKLLMLSH